MYRLTAAAVFMMGTAYAADTPSLCDSALSAAPEMTCAEAPLGVALSVEPARAAQLSLLARAGEERFRRHFGRDPARYAIIEFSSPEQLGGKQRALNDAGFRRTLPWFSQTAYAEAITTAVRAAAEQAAREQGLSASETQAAVRLALETQVPPTDAYAITRDEAGVVPHEMGHGWYTEAFWPGAAMDRDAHYGSPGPDWMDETAAVLMESGDFAEDRRRQFREIYLASEAATSGIEAEDLLSIVDFLHGAHPHAGAANNDPAPADGAPTVQVALDEDAELSRRTTIFYVKARVFADFLIDTTGDEAVFGSIGTAFARGAAFEDWLATEGRARGLATRLPALQRQWRAWLRARYGPPRES